MGSHWGDPQHEQAEHGTTVPCSLLCGPISQFKSWSTGSPVHMTRMVVHFGCSQQSNSKTRSLLLAHLLNLNSVINTWIYEYNFQMWKNQLFYLQIYILHFSILFLHMTLFLPSKLPLSLLYPASHLDAILHSINCTVEFSFTGINTELDQYQRSSTLQILMVQFVL